MPKATASSRNCFASAIARIGVTTVHVRLLNGCEFFAEIGEGGVEQRPDEALEFIDDIECFQINYHLAIFDRFYLNGNDCKRPWRFRFIYTCIPQLAKCSQLLIRMLYLLAPSLDFAPHKSEGR